MQNVVSVLRVSTKRQLNEGDGIENQRRGNDEYVRLKGYRLHREFVVAETASGEDRADFGAVLDYVVAHRREIDVVVFWKVDRISRGGVANYYALKSYLAKHGVRIEFATEQIDATPAGELMESVLAAMARFENRLRVDRTIGVEKILTKDGYWCRAAPTGFVNGRDAHGKPILLPTTDRLQWELLRHGLTKQMQGVFTVNEVAREVRGKGLTSSRGNPISIQSWTMICRSPLYGGLLCGAWTDHRFVRAKFDGPLTPGEWHELQRVLDGRRRVAAPARQQVRPEFPLRRFVRCPACQSPVRGYASRGRRGNQFLYYVCGHAACGFRVPVAEAHRLFVDLLTGMTPSAELLALFRRVVLEVWEANLRELGTESAALQKEVADLRGEKRALLEVMKRSCDNPTLLAELQQDFDRVEKRLTLATITRNEAEVEEFDAEAVVGYCTYFLRHVSELWQLWPVEAQTKVQRLVLPEGIPYDALGPKRTPQFSLVYAAFPDLRASKTSMAPPTVRVANQTILAMIEWYKVLRALPLAESWNLNT
jgi:DNA invertase Pin-like site-specific DNA recombinase